MKKDIVIPDGVYDIPKSTWLSIVIKQTLIIGIPTLGIDTLLLYSTINNTNQWTGIVACCIVGCSFVAGGLAIEKRIKDKLWLEIKKIHFDDSITVMEGETDGKHVE
jgi:hypothetical protein